MPRKNFAFRFAWFESIAHLAAVTRLEVIEATIRYAETGETGAVSTEATEAFEKYILPDFLRRAKAAENRSRRKAILAEKAAKAAAIAAGRARILASTLTSPYFHLAVPCPWALHCPEVLGPRTTAPPQISMINHCITN